MLQKFPLLIGQKPCKHLVTLMNQCYGNIGYSLVIPSLSLLKHKFTCHFPGQGKPYILKTAVIEPPFLQTACNQVILIVKEQFLLTAFANICEKHL